jgi:glucoamylase
MPLLWAHAEYLKLLVAIAAGKPVELLKAVEERYAARVPAAATWHWRTEAPFARLVDGRRLTVEDRSPFVLHFGFDGWQNVSERAATRGPLGLWSVTFIAEELKSYEEINFTRRLDSGWEGADHRVTLGHESVAHGLTHHSATNG